MGEVPTNHLYSASALPGAKVLLMVNTSFELKC